MKHTLFCVYVMVLKVYLKLNIKVILSTGNEYVAPNAFHPHTPLRLTVPLEPADPPVHGGIPTVSVSCG